MSYGSKSKEKIKIEKFLSYRGFSFDEIKRAFGQIARKELRSSNK
jgi:SOS response regulatory protein OraA/RecX